VDGATSYKGSGIGVTMVGLQGETMNYALQLLLAASNNVTEYEELLDGLCFAKGVGAIRIVVYSNS
jgi:ribonuclease HI